MVRVIGTCDVCGKRGISQVTETRGGRVVTSSFCLEHNPADLGGPMPFGPHRTVADEVLFLRQILVDLDQETSDPARRLEVKTQLEQLIADIEAGRRRISDAD